MMDTETEEKLTYMARKIAEEMLRAAGRPALPASTALAACGLEAPVSGCENLLYAPITTQRFYRGSRTEINVVVEGQIPVIPGASVLLSQEAHPPWPTGCFSLRYRLANNGSNHDEIVIEWFLDEEMLDTKFYGSDIYNHDGTLIGDGMLPIPLAQGQHCCVGGNNRLRARIRHTGVSNQIENIRLWVQHGKGVKCCSSCASGKSCGCGSAA